MPETLIHILYQGRSCERSVSVSVRVLALPVPGIAAHLLDAELGSPVKLFRSLRRITVTGADIPCAARLDHIRNGMAAGLAESIHHLKHGISMSGSKVENRHTFLVLQLADRIDMASGKIDYMDVVTHSGSVRCVVVIAKDTQFLQLADGNLRNIGNQIVRDPFRIFGKYARPSESAPASIWSSHRDWCRCPSGIPR